MRARSPPILTPSTASPRASWASICWVWNTRVKRKSRGRATMLKIENRKIKLTDDGPFEALRILASIFIALCATFIVLCLVSQTPVDDFVALLTLPLENSFNFGYVLVKMVPLTFAGLATLLYFRTGLFNLSTEGIFYICGVACTYFAV